MKKLLAIILVLAMVLPTAAVLAEETLTPEDYKSKIVYDDSEYANMTVAELYEAAKKETDTLVVYSETSSTEKTNPFFAELYPEISIEVTKKKSKDIPEIVPLEAESGNAYYDVIVAGDAEGSKIQEWYAKGYAVCYFPEFLKADIAEGLCVGGLPITTEGHDWYYNTNLSPDGSPLTSVWELVEKNEDGTPRFTLLMQDISEITVCAWFTHMIQNADLMEADYKAHYGKDLEYTYDPTVLPDLPENNAGFEFIYRFLQVGYTPASDGDQIVTAVANATTPTLGFASSLKYSEHVFELQEPVNRSVFSPWCGITKTKYIYINPNSKNPAGARLYAIFSLGGEDGTGDAYKKYCDRKGCYASRSSFPDTLNEKPIEEMGWGNTDLTYIYENSWLTQDYFNYIIEELR